ncbi:MAG: DUF4982 domain-containing protein [Opitutaceae bacterium]|nr:DUF4982 domain-containing protein [Opitutaceae bacterium]
MIFLPRWFRTLLLLVCSAGAVAWGAAPAESGRERTSLDAGWRFALGHASDATRDFGHATGYFSYLAKTGFGDGPASVAFDDRAWRQLDVPHDWAVEAPFEAKASYSHGFKAVGPGFPERSVGWYRQHFVVAAADLGRRIRIDFDGVFRNARVFVNGFFVGEEPSGYLPASYDITDYLNYGGDNLVAVRVDASMEEGWFYEGAGIYRHVWLTKTAPVHIPRYGTWVRTEVVGDTANVLVETTLANEGRTPAAGTVSYEIADAAGQVVARAESPASTLAPGTTALRTVVLPVAQPRLWGLASPHLYKLVTTVVQDGRAVDRTETSFGIRTIRFDPDAGFFLNGERVTIKGTNNHQDHAGVGVALPDALQDFRIRQLLAMGSNTYRASHNPPTPELLEACDRLGMFVIDENRLMGSNPYHLGQLEHLIRRDRNHPSVILWSVGNEEWGIEGNIKGARIARTMQDFVHRLDPTRLATAAISGGWGGISSTIEVAGANYIKQAKLDQQHLQYPKQIILGTEETTTQATRGIYFDDRPRAHMAPLEDGTSGGNAEIGWKYYAARPHFAGVVYWTGFDYRGEPTPFGFPAIGSQFGILDTCGFPKDGFYYLKSWWTDEVVLHVFPHWNWAGREGQPIEVRANSNCDEVELFLNGTSLGRQKLERNGHLAWQVTYAPGTLLARGYRGGREIALAKVETTGAAAAVALAADRTTITADGRDVAVLAVSVKDAAGRLVPTAANRIHFSVRGPGRIIGVGNGDPSSQEPDCFVGSVVAQKLGTWKAPEAAVLTGPILFEATFDAPEVPAEGTATLLLNALGTGQSVTLNGQVLCTNATPEQARTEIALAQLNLQPKGNVLRIEATRYADWGAREALQQIHPAAWRIGMPAPAWSRSVFNGLAQVIVQSTGEPGEIVLEAAADGLGGTKAIIAAVPAR